MRNNWLAFVDPDGGSRHMLPMEAFVTNGFGSRVFSHFLGREILAAEAFSCISKFSGSFLLFSRNHLGSALEHCNSSGRLKRLGSALHSSTGFHLNVRSKAVAAAFRKIGTTFQHVFDEAKKLHTCSLLYLATALIPSLNHISLDMLAPPLGTSDIKVHQSVDQRPCEVSRDEYGGVFHPELNWTSQAVEPRTGIEFPKMLDAILDGVNTSRSTSEVLVGTGTKTMKIVRIKSLKVYAFGFYVHPSSVCKKLGQKYATIPEFDKSKDIYHDLLREDIGMSVRLVVNYDGLKINTVKEVFEKSLRVRLVETNPNTDFQCLKDFGSLFSQDAPIPTGTVIDFRRTADGQLITEIGGNQVGAVRSKDLCRAFFGMYIGDLPVSEQTKQEIGKNVASLIKRC